MADTSPRLADHARMMELVGQLSPETRARIAAGMDDRFHEVTSAPHTPGCCAPQATRACPACSGTGVCAACVDADSYACNTCLCTGECVQCDGAGVVEGVGR
jgi:hypothetical protein